MQQDSIRNDTLQARPLPGWLTKQRDGLNAYQPARAEMKADNSLEVSVVSTGLVVLLAVVLITAVILLKHRNKKL